MNDNIVYFHNENNRRYVVAISEIEYFMQSFA